LAITFNLKYLHKSFLIKFFKSAVVFQYTKITQANIKPVSIIMIYVLPACSYTF